GVASLELTGLAGWSDVGPIWLTWWLGDAAGALLVAPAVVLWATNRFVFAPERLAEAAVLAIAALTTGVVIFGGVGPLSVYRVPVAVLTFPVLVWAAFRFGCRGAAWGVLGLAGSGVWGALTGLGR